MILICLEKEKHYRLYEKMGAHLVEVNGYKGVYFAVWAQMQNRYRLLVILITGKGLFIS
jgi:1,4-alpha-glucan branching enzyme